MIKVIAFDLVGVLVSEKDIELSEIESKIERTFGPNISDKEFINNNKYLLEETELIKTTKKIINKLYKVKDNSLFKNIKDNYPDIQIIIATNHVSYIRKYIENNFETKYLDNIIISAEINEIKPNEEFYKYILNNYKISSKELLFLDDNQNNIDAALKLGIKAIKINKNSDIFNIIKNKIKN